MRHAFTRSLALAGLGFLTMMGTLKAQQPAAPAPANRAPIEDRKPGDLPGPIDSLADLEDTAKMLFKMADTNNDNQISQKEANDVGNLLVGGFFFRADANGDGKLTQEEARAARDTVLQQKPYLRVLIQRAKNAGGNNPAGAGGNANANANNAAGTNPFQSVGALLDSNGDKAIEATEVRQALSTAVTALFAQADTNRDGQLTPTELNAFAIGAARAAAQAAFRAADADHNGQLSRDEFDKAIVEPANRIFAMADANGDGQISEQEAQQARQFVMSQLQRSRLPEAPNSPRSLLRSGAAPDQVAPVPNVTAPGTAPRNR